jgi:prefoldin subunit 5
VKKSKGEKVKMLLAMVGLGALVYFAMVGIFGERSVSAQTDTLLSRRIDQVEQRFYTLESRMSRIEQESRRPAVTSPTIIDNNAVELQYLRTQIESLRARLGEVECSVLKVDERTLTAAARAARTRSGNPEPCRSDPNGPVQLSARPGS